MSLLLLSAFAWVWKTSLVAIVLIGLVLLVQFALQKFLPARWRYALWLLVVVRLLMPVVPSSRYGVFNSGPLQSLFGSPSFIAVPAPVRSEGPIGVIGVRPLSPDPRGGRAEGGVRSGQYWAQGGSVSSPSLEGGEGEERRGGPAWITTAKSFRATAPWVWVVGAIGYLLAVLAQQRRLSLWVNRQKPVISGRVISMIEDAKEMLGLRQDVPVIETNGKRAPSVFGYLKPRLLVSKETIEQLRNQELRLVILHELVHVQRRDVLLNWLLILLQALHWFNPVVWLGLRRLRSDRELVCDAAVMRHLTVEERHAYGATLIKMLDSISKAPLIPSLVPILNHKHEIHRRIVMIAQFKPTARLVTLASALLLFALGCVSFTLTAEKPSPTPAEKPGPETDLDKQRDTSRHGLRILEDELAKQENRVREKQQELDALKEKLQIAESDDAGQGKTWGEPEMVRRLKDVRLEAQAGFIRADCIFTNLSNLSRQDLKKAILTVAPDQVLAELLSRQAVTETKMAELRETYGSDHPEVKRTRALLENTSRQIEERLEGILIGLRTKRDSEKAALDSLRAEMEQTKRSEIESAIKRRPYAQAKRELDSLEYMRDKLTLRILQEKVEAAMPK